MPPPEFTYPSSGVNAGYDLYIDFPYPLIGLGQNMTNRFSGHQGLGQLDINLAEKVDGHFHIELNTPVSQSQPVSVTYDGGSPIPTDTRGSKVAPFTYVIKPI